MESELINIIDKSTNKRLFIYIVIIIVFGYFFSKLSIGLNIVFGLIIAVIVIYYINKKESSDIIEEEKIHEIKKDSIRPTPKRIHDYKELLDFFFSIQDYYQYNQQSYENTIDSVDDFLMFYEELKRTNKKAGLFFESMELKKHNAMNALQSIIHNLPNNKELVQKLSDACVILGDLLNIYLTETYEINKKYLTKNGYNNTSVNIYLGAKPNNFYESNDYDFF